jgi:glycosyltransferase involved in cell wall biosynthesis
LAPCLNSILAAIDRAQVKAELIVVDNGSSDGTANVLARSRDARVQALQESQLGKARALNRALDIAKGELLAFIDDDRRTHPDYVQDLLRHYEADTEPVLRGGRIEPIPNPCCAAGGSSWAIPPIYHSPSTPATFANVGTSP